MDFLWLLSSIRNPVLDTIMLAFSYIGTPFVIAGIIGWIYLNNDKKEAYGISLSFILSCLLCQGVKVLARVPRPWNLDPTFKAVDASYSTATGYSFPSVHTQSITSVGLSCFYYNKKKPMRIISVALIVIVGFSRMYLGCHTPLDVGCAFLVTAVITAITWAIWNRHNRSFLDGNMLPFFVLAFSLALIFLVSALLINGTVDYANVKDSYETSGAAIGFVVAFLVEPRFICFSVEGSFKKKLIRFLIAVGGAVAIEFGLKAVFKDNIPMLVVRYALLTSWIMVLTPLISLRTGLAEKERAAQKLPQI